MKSLHYSIILSAIICATLVFSSCRKDRRDTLGSSISTDNSTAENLFSDMFKVVDNVSATTEGIRENEFGCIDTILVDTLSNPRSITIDFGNDACVGEDGRIRTGILHVTYTGRYREPGTEITITPENYTVDGYSINGTKIIENLGFNDSGQLHFGIIAYGTISAPDNAWTVSWQSDRVRTWVEGQSTATIWDDVYEISGTGSGVNRNSIPYTLLITSPLRAEVSCRWIVSGAMSIEPEDFATRYIDFGNGECNNGFTVTVNGEEYQLGSE